MKDKNLFIKLGGLEHPAVIQLLKDHHNEMLALSPPESVHALDLSKLSTPDITFWSVWIGDDLAGCGALKTLNPKEAEIKSMRTSATHIRKGVAKALLKHILEYALQNNFQTLKLETGTLKEFEPAQRLYESFGFAECEPFADYTLDPYSKYMSLILNK